MSDEPETWVDEEGVERPVYRVQHFDVAVDCADDDELWTSEPLATVPFDETGARERAGDGLEGLEW